MGSIFEKSNSV